MVTARPHCGEGSLDSPSQCWVCDRAAESTWGAVMYSGCPPWQARCPHQHRAPKGLSSTFPHVSAKHRCRFSTLFFSWCTIAFFHREKVLSTTDPPESLLGPWSLITDSCLVFCSGASLGLIRDWFTVVRYLGEGRMNRAGTIKQTDKLVVLRPLGDCGFPFLHPLSETLQLVPG